MRYVKLNDVEEHTIVEMRKYHQKARVRERAMMIELSNKGKSIDQITEIVGKNRDTVSTWLSNYEKSGITGLIDKSKPGRNPKVKDPVKTKIFEIAQSDNTCTSEYITEIIEKEFNLKLHPNTVKYHLKKRKVRLQTHKKQPQSQKRWVKIQ
jgi:transposase